MDSRRTQMQTRRVQVVCELETKNIRDMDEMTDELKKLPRCSAVEGDEIFLGGAEQKRLHGLVVHPRGHGNKIVTGGAFFDL